MRALKTLVLLVVLCSLARAQSTPYVTLGGVIQGPNGLPASNTIISLTPTQMFFVGGNGPACGGYLLSVNGFNLNCGDPVNFNNTNPVAPPNGININWSTLNVLGTDFISAALIGDGNSNHYLNGAGLYTTPPGGGGGSGSFYQTLSVAGTALAQEPAFNFVSGMTCADNPGASRTDCTVQTSPLSSAVGTSYTAGTGNNPGSLNIDNEAGVITATSDYDFSACASGCTYVTSVATTLAVGANTVTLTPVPIGVNGADPAHYIQITPAGGDPSPTEWVTITGGTAVSGAASGTLTFSAAYSHLANYKLQSGSNGIQEAFETTGSPGAKVKLVAGKTYTCNAPIFLHNQDVRLDGQWAILLHASFSSCLVYGPQSGLWGTDTGQNSYDVSHIDFRPKQVNWSVLPTGSIAGNSPTATLTIPTCPANFWANIPNQLLWLAGTSAGSPLTVYGYGEYVMTTAGTCAPSVVNGTVTIKQVTPNVTNLSPHDAGFSLSNGVGPYIEDAINGGHTHHMRWATGSGGGVAGNLIQINNDQLCQIDNINATGGTLSRKDADFQSSGIFAPGAFALNAGICNVGPAVEFSEPSSCVRWYSGNDFTWQEGICQNYSTGGIIVGQKRGGFGKFALGPNIHFETGSTAPPWGAGNILGNPAIMVIGGSNTPLINLQSGLPGGISSANASPYPLFANLGAQTAVQYYYLVARNNALGGCTGGSDCFSPPIMIGAAVTTDPSANPVTVHFYGWGSGQPTSPTNNPTAYDLLRVPSSSGSLGVGIPQAPAGTGNYAVATNQATASICNIKNLCTITDNVAPGALGAYTMTLGSSNKRYYPVAQLMPGAIAMTGDNGVNNTGTPASYRGMPTCYNAMEFPGTRIVGDFISHFLGNETMIGQGCPNAAAQMSFPGAPQICLSSTGACSLASVGSVTIAAGATTVTVATTAVQPWSRFEVTENATTGTALGVTCNTTLGRTYMVTTMTPGVSFVITASAAPAATPACLDFKINN